MLTERGDGIDGIEYYYNFRSGPSVIGEEGWIHYNCITQYSGFVSIEQSGLVRFNPIGSECLTRSDHDITKGHNEE